MKPALLCLPALLALSPLAACAAEARTDYPTKPIRMIVTFTPGGGTDIVARAVGGKFTEAWGHQVVIDNRAGAGGVIGTETAARAAPDGYTLLFGTSSGMVINPLLNSKLPYVPARDFAPVSLVSINPTMLAVNAGVPVHNVKELIALGKAKPGQLNYGTVGAGSPIHLAMELFKAMTGTNFVHVPYKGSPLAVTDLLAGQIQLMFNSMPTMLPHVRTGKLRALAVGSAKRSRTVPDLPTVAESGVPGFETVTWFGVFAPAATPKPIVSKLNSEIHRMLGDAEMVQRLQVQGSDAQASTPEYMAQYMKEESERWRNLIRTVNIKLD
jgi:tripartite-type tricarboxylate transporter receptor subunit TctC